ncbi:sulfate adenylyltransferase subunit CysD [Pelagibacteraceae bacterium]|nr:sulfate adenylyltransferase subunit CysD [Pelagibacteraceae bacterium]
MTVKIPFKNTLLAKLESEAISIIRDSFSKSLNPVLMYSIGKDSSVLLHLARKAFYPSPIPFPLLHIDTKWKFKEMYAFKEKIQKKLNINIITYVNLDGLVKKIDPSNSPSVHTDVMKTEALKQALDHYKFDFVFGGARRDEEQSRSKERIVSVRERNHIWDPKNQRPELWSLFNFNKNQDQSFRIFPISNWTEQDIWKYILQENIEIVNLYYAKKRPTIIRNGSIFLVDDHRLTLKKNEKIFQRKVRFRTLGCYPLTTAMESNAKNIREILAENKKIHFSERAGRLIDLDKINSMEIKKKNGYF